MMKEDGNPIVLAGWADDVALTYKLIGASKYPFFLVNEHTETIDFPPKATIVVFLANSDTFYSSRLLSIFSYLHDHVKSQRELVVSTIDQPPEVLFDCIRNIKVVSMSALVTLMKNEHQKSQPNPYKVSPRQGQK